MKSIANALAKDLKASTEDIADAVDYLRKNIIEAEASGRPVSFAAYQSKVVMEMALCIRTHNFGDGHDGELES